MDTFVDFFERNIGDEGIDLETKIQNEFERQTGSLFSEINKMEISLDADIRHYDNIMGDMTIKGWKSGGKLLANAGIKISAEGVKNARNLIMPTFKFKPWGAIKLANNMNKAIPIVGLILSIGFEAWDTYDQMKKEQEFKKAIDEIVSKFEQQRKEYLQFINDEDAFARELFPSYFDIEKRLEELFKELRDKETLNKKLKKWCEAGEAIAIEAEFEIIS
jgi:hypothetical protein